MNEEQSLEDSMIDLAKQLRAAFWEAEGIKRGPWEESISQESWLRVANEAFKWLVG